MHIDPRRRSLKYCQDLIMDIIGTWTVNLPPDKGTIAFQPTRHELIYITKEPTFAAALVLAKGSACRERVAWTIRTCYYEYFVNGVRDVGADVRCTIVRTRRANDAHRRTSYHRDIPLSDLHTINWPTLTGGWDMVILLQGPAVHNARLELHFLGKSRTLI